MIVGRYMEYQKYSQKLLHLKEKESGGVAVIMSLPETSVIFVFVSNPEAEMIHLQFRSQSGRTTDVVE